MFIISDDKPDGFGGISHGQVCCGMTGGLSGGVAGGCYSIGESWACVLMLRVMGWL